MNTYVIMGNAGFISRQLMEDLENQKFNSIDEIWRDLEAVFETTKDSGYLKVMTISEFMDILNDSCEGDEIDWLENNFFSYVYTFE